MAANHSADRWKPEVYEPTVSSLLADFDAATSSFALPSREFGEVTKIIMPRASPATNLKSLTASYCRFFTTTGLTAMCVLVPRNSV